MGLIIKYNFKQSILFNSCFLNNSVFLYMSIQVVTDEKGKKTAVLVPIADWEEIQKRLNTEILLDEFTSSINDIKKDINGSIKLRNAKDLIREH